MIAGLENGPPLKILLRGQETLRKELTRARHSDLTHRISVKHQSSLNDLREQRLDARACRPDDLLIPSPVPQHDRTGRMPERERIIL